MRATFRQVSAVKYYTLMLCHFIWYFAREKMMYLTQLYVLNDLGNVNEIWYKSQYHVDIWNHVALFFKMNVSSNMLITLF